MPNAAIYARFSCSRQRSESIEDQVRVCTAAAEGGGYRVVKVYADQAMSGRTDDRPQFQRMLADSSKGLFDALFVYKTDRFARNRYDSAVNKARLRKNGVKVIAAAESIPDGADGILMEAVLEGMAEYYSAQLSQNIKRGIEGNARRCLANGKRLFGYDIVDGRYQINESEAAIVRTMFEVYDSQKSVRAVLDALSGSRTRQGAKWSYATVGKALRNESYAGVYSYAGIRVEGGMPAIVERKIFDSVNAKLKERHHAPRIDDAIYILSNRMHDESGNVFVGTCGTGKHGKRYHYYLCKETNKRIPRDDFDQRIAEACARDLSDPDIAEEIADLILEAQAEILAEEPSRIEALKKELSKAEKSLDNVVNAIAEVGINARLREKMEALECEIAELQGEIADESAECPILTKDMVLFWLADIVGNVSTDDLLANFVSDVIVRDDGSVLVAFVMDELPLKTKEHPKAEASECSHNYRMVEMKKLGANPRIIAFERGFALIA